MATLITKNSSTASAVPAAGDLVKGELAVNVTDKKVYTKDNSAAVVKLVGSLGNQEASAVAITGGTINGTTIGATTPSTGAFTTASASSGFTGNLTGNVTGNVSGTASNVTGVVAIANGGTGLSSLGTGVQTALGQNVTGSGSIVLATSPSLTTPNLGTPSAAVLTNATGLPLTTGVTGTLGVANGGTGITAFGTGVATALGQNVTGSGGIVLATSPSLTTPNLGTPSAVTLTNATGLPISTGVSGLGTGVATALAVNTGSSGAFVVNGGALGTPSSGTLTNATGLPLSTGVTGTLATTNGGTGLTSFTANGVVYASSSSALTTGSALSFDGTNLGVGTASPSGKLHVQATNSGIYFDLATANTPKIIAAGILTDLQLEAVGDGGNIINKIAAGSSVFQWLQSSSELMRLTSTGLGIGTSSPGAKLDVNGTIYSRTGGVYTDTLTAYSGSSISVNAGSSYFAVTVNGSERMRLDSSGNLGLGVTPSAWQSATIRPIEINRIGNFVGGNGSAAAVYLGANTRFESANWRYANNGAAGLYTVEDNTHFWRVAASGTAGDPISFTQALTLTADGNLAVGLTATSYRLNATVQSGADRDVFAAQISGASNGLTVKWNHATTTTRVNIANLPTSSAGLASGDLWNDSGTLKVA